MAFELHRSQGFPAFAASNVAARIPVQLTTVARGVIPAATAGVEPFGVSGAAAASQGDAIAIHEPKSIVKAIAAASVGPGADVMVATANGRLGPAAAGASGIVRWAVGKSMDAAAAGETFSVYVNPRQISGFPA